MLEQIFMMMLCSSNWVDLWSQLNTENNVVYHLKSLTYSENHRKSRNCTRVEKQPGHILFLYICVQAPEHTTSVSQCFTVFLPSWDCYKRRSWKETREHLVDDLEQKVNRIWNEGAEKQQHVPDTACLCLCSLFDTRLADSVTVCDEDEQKRDRRSCTEASVCQRIELHEQTRNLIIMILLNERSSLSVVSLISVVLSALWFIFWCKYFYYKHYSDYLVLYS